MRAGRPALVAAVAAALTAVALAAAAAAGAARVAAAPVWSGTWDTSRGPLTLAVAGTAVKGTFGYSDSRNEPTGTLEGVVSGNAITGTWKYDAADFAPMDNGPFSLGWGPLVGGKATFTGQMVFKANSSTFDWTGTCKAGACTKAGSPPTVKAFGGSATAGKVFELRYRVYDDGATASAVLTVAKGAKVLYRKAVAASPVGSGQLGFREWLVPRSAKGSSLVFTVVAKDDAGMTATARATITVR